LGSSEIKGTEVPHFELTKPHTAKESAEEQLTDKGKQAKKYRNEA
jgi:hypothetical protein